MCGNCLSQAEVLVGHTAIVAAALHRPLGRVAAWLGLSQPEDPAERDAWTVAFLRELDLDPIAILGADVVATAAEWTRTRQPARARASARPIGSQIVLHTP